jgi:nicotinamidase-related amidase
MQVALFTAETPRYDADGVINRINALGRIIRETGGIVVFVRHDQAQGGALEPGTHGWQLLPSLERDTDDLVVHKNACVSFYNSDLESALGPKKVRRLIVSGCATDFYVETTVRAALSRDYKVTVVADGHTTDDRPRIDAASLVRHHNWLRQNLIHPQTRIEVMQTKELIARCSTD